MSDLPTGWESAPVADLVSPDGLFNDGDWVESKDQDPDGQIRLLQLADIGDGYFVDKSSRFINDNKFEELRCTELKENDVLIARMPDPLGRACLMPQLPQKCITVVDVAILRSGKNGVFSPWLMHSINAPQFRAEIEINSSGTTRKRISRGNLSAMMLPVPPLPEQKRIADKLDSVLARVDACRDRLDRLPALLKRFRQSILSAATSGRLTEDWRNNAHKAGENKLLAARSPIVIFPGDQDGLVDNWRWRQLTVLARLESGHTPRKSVPEYWENGTVPWISLQDIREADGTVIQDTKHKPTELGIANSSARLLPADTVCFCRDISFGYVTIMGKEMATTQHFANWVCGDQLVPKYLMYAFMAARNFLGMSGQGTTVTTIYMPALKELRLATPPIEEQHEIVRRVETLFAFADRLEARLGSARAQVDKLTPALLAKAFRGELVPQDPADEPASELLKRLAAARAEASTAPKPKRGRTSAG